MKRDYIVGENISTLEVDDLVLVTEDQDGFEELEAIRDAMKSISFKIDDRIELYTSKSCNRGVMTFDGIIVHDDSLDFISLKDIVSFAEDGYPIIRPMWLQMYTYAKVYETSKTDAEATSKEQDANKAAAAMYLEAVGINEITSTFESESDTNEISGNIQDFILSATSEFLNSDRLKFIQGKCESNSSEDDHKISRQVYVIETNTSPDPDLIIELDYMDQEELEDIVKSSYTNTESLMEALEEHNPEIISGDAIAIENW